MGHRPKSRSGRAQASTFPAGRKWCRPTAPAVVSRICGEAQSRGTAIYYCRGGRRSITTRSAGAEHSCRCWASPVIQTHALQGHGLASAFYCAVLPPGIHRYARHRKTRGRGRQCRAARRHYLALHDDLDLRERLKHRQNKPIKFSSGHVARFVSLACLPEQNMNNNQITFARKHARRSGRGAQGRIALVAARNGIPRCIRSKARTRTRPQVRWPGRGNPA